MFRLFISKLSVIVFALAVSTPVVCFAQDAPNERYRPLAGPGSAGEDATKLPPDFFHSAQIVAMVDGHPVLAGDLLGTINQMLAPYEGKAPPEEIDKQRVKLMRRMLPVVVDTKLAYLDFLRKVPAERVPDVLKQLEKEFDKQRLELMLKKANVATEAELDAKLRKYGSSLYKEKRVFIEQFLAQQKMRMEVNLEPEITHDKMLKYYRNHPEKYKIAAKARWEKLSVRFDRFPNKAEAFRALASMGNEVLRGAPFKAVAKRSSHGLNAHEGGFHDWTTQDSLASKVLDKAIFTLPEGKLSRILEDSQEFHIVRVIERLDDSKVSFVEAQVEIKKLLIQESVKKDRIAYTKRLHKDAPVWTIFDKQVPQTASQGDPSQRR